MTFEQLRTLQSEAYRILQNSFYLEKLTHAYLFEGVLGCGNEEMATYMAMQLLCESSASPCMECSNCKKVLSNTHMNVIRITPNGEMIKKDQIEDLIHEFSMSSLEGGAQIYIIEHAEKMNTSAANALLKFLEEPVPNRYGFLITSNKDIMLPTIISRTQVIHFKPLSTSLLLQALKEQGIDDDVAYASISLTNDIEDITKMISEGKLTNYVSVAKDVMKAILNGEDPFVVYYLKRDLFFEETSSMWHHFFLDVISLIYQSMIKENLKGESDHFKDVLVNKKVQISRKNIDNKLNLITTYQERLNYFVNIPLFYASFFCELAKEN